MQDDSFARLVAEEVKNKVTEQQRDYLRLPDNWSRWQRALLALIDNLNNQIDEIAEAEKNVTERYSSFGDEGLRLITESLSEYETRKKKISRFKFHVEARLDEVTRMISMGSEAVDERLKTVDFMRRAIERHRELIMDLDMDYSDVDEALWAALEGNWDFDKITDEG